MVDRLNSRVPPAVRLVCGYDLAPGAVEVQLDGHYNAALPAIWPEQGGARRVVIQTDRRDSVRSRRPRCRYFLSAGHKGNRGFMRLPGMRATSLAKKWIE